MTTTRNQNASDNAPPRRSGRRCGYPNNNQLDTARIALAATLTALARDPDPAIRQQGADLALEAAQTLTELANQATTLANRS